MSFQKELTVLQKQDKWTLIDWGNPFNFSDSESETTSSRSSQQRKKREAFPPSIQYGSFFPDETSMSVPPDELMPASSQVVGSQTTPLQEHPPTSRIAPLLGKGDPPISVTGMLPRLLRKTWAGRNMWQHMCSINSPEFKDALLIARAKKGSEHTPEEYMILSPALKHKKTQAHTSKPAPFMIQPGITKELTIMYLSNTHCLTGQLKWKLS